MLTRQDSFFYLKIKHRPFTDFFLTAARSFFFYQINITWRIIFFYCEFDQLSRQCQTVFHVD